MGMLAEGRTQVGPAALIAGAALLAALALAIWLMVALASRPVSRLAAATAAIAGGAATQVQATSGELAEQAECLRRKVDEVLGGRRAA